MVKLSSLRRAPKSAERQEPDVPIPWRRKPDVFGQSMVRKWQENDAACVAEEFAKSRLTRTA